jgi:tyrosyl-tRNA synthetase
MLILKLKFKSLKPNNTMDLEKRLELVKAVGEEIITEQELKELLETKQHPVAYDGFEPSGRMHIAQGILRAINVNKMVKAGIRFKILVADWFAWMNKKFQGDIEKIQVAGDYFIEAWKACGMKTEKINFIWSKDLIREKDYWKTTIDIARHATVHRIMRCSQIMGRHEHEILSAAQIIYPCMQVADIFHLKSDLTQLGMDQRKVNVLAREIGPKIGFWKPVVVSHHMLLGLHKPVSKAKDWAERILDIKMSKSKPDSAIFIDDSEQDIKKKINKAYCPEKNIKDNPILEYCKYIIFEKIKSMHIERPSKFGGDLEIQSFDELSKIYREGKLHPMDLKNSVAYYLNEFIKPIREHFEHNPKAKKLYEFVKRQEITR